MRRVSQYDKNWKFIKEHRSIAEAARELKLDESTIRTAVNDVTKTAGGYRWGESFKWAGIHTHASELRHVRAHPLTPKECYKTPMILLLDIETAPNKAYVWRLWKQDVGLPQIISNWFILTWSAKWLGEEQVFSERLYEEEVYLEDDKRIMKVLWSMLDEAIAVVGHNSDRFDVPKISSRFLVHGILPPSSYRQIDTKVVAKKQFGFESNKLQHLADQLGIEGKMDTDFELWSRCMNGEEEALKYMEAYNRHDVVVLEKVYLKLRPYIKGHPNLDMHYDDELPHCPLCGSRNIVPELDKKFYTQAVKYQLYRCKDCNGLSRAKRGDKYVNKKMISAIPR